MDRTEGRGVRGSPPDEETPILGRRPGDASNSKRGAATAEDDNSNEPTSGAGVVEKDDAGSTGNRNGGGAAAASTFLRSIPAAVLITALNLMLSVPFGSAYFSPVIPLDETRREAFGIRLALLALAVGQAVYGGGASAFDPAIMWQLGELSPFYHKLAEIAAAAARDDEDIWPTTLYLLSLSTLTVALSFYLLGKFGLGQLTYFFPTHVLLGLIGGVGVWLAILSMSVSVSPSRAPPGPPIASAWTVQFLVTLVFAVVLRILRSIFPKEKFMFLDPIFFLFIPLAFYGALYALKIDVQDAVDSGYFFGDPDAAGDVGGTSAWADAAELWTTFDVTKVRWGSIVFAMPTLLTSGLMGVMLSAPFIPATAMIFGEENFDYNREFIASGYANALSAIACPGGLGIALCYSTTFVYMGAGGKGKLANCLISLLTAVCFVYGPRFVVYIPRCMAGSIVFDMGVSLFLEAVVDPAKKCDAFEYTTILIILVVMNVFDMTSALVAGLLAAVLTYALQSSLDKDPVRIVCDATTIPSSKWRSATAMAILEDERKGRARIGIFQLQGQLFFGNVSQVEGTIFDFLAKRRKNGEDIRMVVLDFTLVLGIDTTAASFIEKMIPRIQKQFDASTVIVSGPLEESIQKEQSSGRHLRQSTLHNATPPSVAFSRDSEGEARRPTVDRRVSTTVRGPYETLEREACIHGKYFRSLDEALISCEDNLVAQYDVSSLLSLHSSAFREDHEEIVKILTSHYEEATEELLQDLPNYCERQVHTKGDILWFCGDEGDSAKILLSGELSAFTDEEHSGEKKDHYRFETGDVIGLRCLILKEKHLATVRCKEECIFFSIDRNSWDKLVEERPRIAHLFTTFLAQDLSRRLQHVSNKIYLSRQVLH